MGISNIQDYKAVSERSSLVSEFIGLITLFHIEAVEIYHGRAALWKSPTTVAGDPGWLYMP